MALSRENISFFPSIDRVLPRVDRRERDAALSLASVIEDKASSHVDSEGRPVDSVTHKLRTPDSGVVYLTPGELVTSVSWPAMVEGRLHDLIGRATLYIDLQSGRVESSLRVERWENQGRDITPNHIRTKRPDVGLRIGIEQLSELEGLVSSGEEFIDQAQFPA